MYMYLYFNCDLQFIASLNLKLKSSVETNVEEEEKLDEFAEVCSLFLYFNFC